MAERSRNSGKGESRLFGRYELAFELAAGGMATVFLARAKGAAGFEKIVALKRIHPHLAKESDFVEMFLDEARLASRIDHPSVCSVFDFGEVDGVYYIAMEYILGETFRRLARRLSLERKSPLDIKVARYIARIVAEACEGLHAAHELKGNDGRPLNVVHRDVTPHNLFVAYDGSVRIVDFGIARAEGRLHNTRTGAVKGKIAYMSPEQGRKLKLDRRSDLWAMGVVLWELLVGKRLFRRDNDIDTIVALATEEVPRPSAVREGVPEELDDIVMRALSRDRDQRYPTARAFGRALHRFIARGDDPVIQPDIADWMDDVFAEEKAHRLELIELARDVRDGPVVRVSDDLRPEGSGSEVISASSIRAIEPPEDKTVQTPAASLILPIAPPGADVEMPTEALAEDVADELADDPPPEERPVAEFPEEKTVEPLTLPVNRTPLILLLVLAGCFVFGVLAAGAYWALSDDEPDAVATTASPDEPETPAHAEPEPAHAEEEVAEEEVAEEEVAEEEVEAPRPQRPRRRRDRAPPPPRGFGHVNIATPGGWGDVYLGNQNLGRAPGRVRVPAGRHTLTVRPFGRTPGRSVRVNVRAGGNTRAVVRLSN